MTDKFIDSLLKAPKDFCPEYVGWPYLSFATRYNAYCKTTKGTRANTNSHCQGNSGYYSKISYNPNNNLMTSIYTNCNGISFRVIMKMKKNGSFIEDGTSQNKRYYFDKSGFVYKFEDSLSYGQGHRYVCTMRP